MAPICHLSPPDIYNIFFSGFTAGYCTYTVQDLSSNAIVGLYVAQKYQASIFHILPLTIQDQVNNDSFQAKSSAEMEPFACKTILLHLALDHQLYIDTFTTDRSTSVKAMIGYVALVLISIF